MAAHKRGPWSQEEDERLLRLVNSQGAHYWVRISHMLATRSPKQCRERFHQNLKPSLNHKPISPEEGVLIEQLVGEMGKRWAEIARRLHGRSDNAVKNWWNGGMNRRRRLVVRGGTSHDPSQLHFDERGAALSFARPVTDVERNTIRTTVLPAPKNYLGRPVPSPTALSDGSNASSAGHTPSLMSDSGSMPSTSPCLPLPIPLPSIGAPFRRASLPAFQLRTNTFVSDNQAHSPLGWSARSDVDHNMVEPRTPKVPSLDPRLQLPPVAKKSSTEEKQQSTRSLPENQLPSFREVTDAVKRPGARDSRIPLSTLLSG
ncbi:MAG: hypothetical protein M1816_005113 [Peltula sp. TS41687]|nr:MAG: hypothetical protein M1816_005113 [Peltula sp. TS41687]